MKSTRNEELALDGALQSAPRRSFLKGAGMSGLAIAGAAILGEGRATAAQSSAQSSAQPSMPPAAGLTSTDIEVLNFALNLEYLEAEFYTKAFYGLTLEEVGIKTKGTGYHGVTVGGAKINFEQMVDDSGNPTGTMEFSGKLKAVVKQITKDEQTHVKLLRSLLGSSAIAKPAINLNATPWDMNFKTFLNQARDFEDVGASAYGGAAGLLSTTALSYGARIALVEAYHASSLRFLVAENGVMSPAVDSLDVPPPPTGNYYFTVDSNALAIVRTPSQVLSIVYNNAKPGTSFGAFFPNGVNGAIISV